MAADHDLLFGLRAFKNGLIDESQLEVGIRAWAHNQSLTLADHLVALGHVSSAQRPALETIAAIHIEVHDGDSVNDLNTLATGTNTLATLGDTELAETLANAGADTVRESVRGTSVSVGGATSTGQRFRILRPHARGGLGTVSVAMDQELHREVALKQILDKHADDPVSRARFLLEAEVTGGLEHPGIVPVYGLGTDSGGRPYYAMRFIKGDSLKEAVDAFHVRPASLPAGGTGPKPKQDGRAADPGKRSLELRKLLLRFLDVCNAIEYAHSRGVLHRDIKPGNIIVGAHGETLVVDWGLAKATGRTDFSMELGAETLIPSSASGSAETLPGSTMGTPGFMSPEQAEGDLEKLGTRSDVYSLGATLYYLLTGQPPVDGKLAEVLRAVKAGEIPPPRHHDPTIDRALDAVCQKAMAHKPEDRYASPKELAEDVERWMADEPVSARRDPLLRRARRWARQNRTAVTAAAVALFVGILGLSGVLVIQTQAKQEISRALGRETQANKALGLANQELSRSRAAVEARYDLAVQAIKTFHTGVSEDFLLKEEKFRSLRDRLLKSAAEFYDKLSALLEKDTGRDSRRALASANFELASLTAMVGRNADALAAHQSVLSARRKLAADPRADASALADVGRSLAEVAGLLGSAGKTDEALAAYEDAVQSLSQVAPGSPEVRGALAACRSRMGGLLTSIGKNEQAIEAYRSARADQERLAADAHATPEDRRELADTVNRIGRLFANTGRPREAVEEYRAALVIRKKLVDNFPNNSEYRNALAASHNNLGLVLWQTGQLKEAEDEYRTALAIRKKLSEDNPAVSEFRKQLQASHFNLSNLMRQTGRLKDAEELLRSAIVIQQELADANPAVPELRRLLALNHHYLALVLKGTGRAKEGEAEFRLARSMFEELVKTYPAVTQYRSDLGSTHTELGVLLAESGRPSEAETEFRAGVQSNQELVDANPTVTEFRDRLATGHVNLGEFLSDAGRSAEAEVEYRVAEENFRGLAKANPSVTYFRNGLAYTVMRRGLLLARSGALKEASALYRDAVELYQSLSDKSPKSLDFADGLALAHTRLGDVLRLSGETNEARVQYDRAISVRERLMKENPKAAALASGLAFSLRRRGLARRDVHDFAGAVGDTKQACDLWEKLPSRTAEDSFECGCAHAALFDLAGHEGSGISAAERSAEGSKALEFLRKAVEMDYRNSETYRTETALDPLRDQPEFQRLVEDLTRK
jgi:serine/threonine-protein kinase